MMYTIDNIENNNNEAVVIPYAQFWDKQEQLMHCDPDVDVDIACYQGGYGSGKTFIGALLGLLLSQQYPGIRGMAVAKTYPLLRDTTLETYFEHLEAFGLMEGVDYTWRATQAKLVFHCWGGSEILFRHLENPGKLKSLNLGWIHPEEMSQLSESDFLMLLSRLRQPGVRRYRLFGTTNPEEGKGWLHKFFVEKAGKHRVVRDDGVEAVFCYRRVIASTRENKALPAAYVENLANAFDEAYARMNIDGLDSDYTSGLVVKNWSEGNEELTAYRPDLRIYLSCDFNVDPMCWVLAHRMNGEYHFFDELCLEKTTTMMAAEELVKRYGDHKAGIIITGDASGNNRSTQSSGPGQTNYTMIRNVLAQHQVPNVSIDIRQANPPVADRVAAWNAFVCNSMGVRRIKLNPKTCVRLKWNMENLSYIEGTSVINEPTPREIRDDLSRTLKFTKHPYDAASYLIERYDPIMLLSEAMKKPQIVTQKFIPINF